MSEMKHTPGPWAWFGNAKLNELHLATTHSGRRYVMQFARWGMQNGQPRLQVDRVMADASDLLTFAVGNPEVRGIAAAKKDDSVYRYDISGIDHPDARLIASAPELLEALILLETEKSDYMRRNNLGDPAHQHTHKQARAAIARATGQEPVA